MKPIELATIRSTEELLVHLDRVPRRFTVLELSTALCVSPYALLDSLGHPANVDFAHALYEQLVTTDWSEGLIDDEGLMIPLPEATQLVQGSTTLREHEDVFHFLSLGARFGHSDPVNWRLPQHEFVTAKQHFPAPDATSILTSYQGKQACLKAYENPVGKEALSLLRTKVERLEAALKVAAQRLADHRLHLGLLQNTARILEFVERDQRNRGFEADRYHESIRRIHEVGRQFERLELRLSDRLTMPRGARDAGNDLLALLTPGFSKYVESHEVLIKILERPFRVEPAVLHEMLALLERAFAALAASPVADKFVEYHLCDLLEETCASYPSAPHGLFDDIAGTIVGDTAIDGWEEVFAGLRRELKIGSQKSPLVWLVKGGDLGKRAMSLVTAALHERTIATILEALIERAESRALGGKNLAGILLRYLTFTAVQAGVREQQSFPPPGANAQQIIFAGKHATLHRVKALLVDESLDAKERMEAFKELQLDKGVFRTPKVIGATVALSIMSLAVLLEDDDMPLPKKAIATAMQTGVLVGGALKAEEYIYIRRTGIGDTDPVRARYNAQKLLGAGVAALGFIIAAWTLHEDFDRRDGAQVAFGLVDSAGSLARLLATEAIPVARLAAYAPALGIIGNVIGVAVILAQIAYDILHRSPLELLRTYVDQIEGEADTDFEKSSWVNQNAASIIADVRAALTAADQADARTFAPFKFERGSPDNDKVFEGRLTVNKAIKLGFTKHEIAPMFGVSLQVIEPYFTGPDQ